MIFVSLLFPTLCWSFALLSQTRTTRKHPRCNLILTHHDFGKNRIRYSRRWMTEVGHAGDREPQAVRRRSFLAQSTALVLSTAISQLSAEPACAASGTTSDDKMTIPKNRKIGGLALKIRAVTNVMVCYNLHCCWIRTYCTCVA